MASEHISEAHVISSETPPPRAPTGMAKIQNHVQRELTPSTGGVRSAETLGGFLQSRTLTMRSAVSPLVFTQRS